MFLKVLKNTVYIYHENKYTLLAPLTPPPRVVQRLRTHWDPSCCLLAAPPSTPMMRSSTAFTALGASSSTSLGIEWTCCPDRSTKRCPGWVARSGHLFIMTPGHHFMTPWHLFILCPGQGTFLCPKRGTFLWPRGRFLCLGRTISCPDREPKVMKSFKFYLIFMKLTKFIIKDSPSRTILDHFCNQIGGVIARYTYNDAMAANVWVQYFPRSSHISVVER